MYIVSDSRNVCSGRINKMLFKVIYFSRFSGALLMLRGTLNC